MDRHDNSTIQKYIHCLIIDIWLDWKIADFVNLVSLENFTYVNFVYIVVHILFVSENHTERSTNVHYQYPGCCHVWGRIHVIRLGTMSASSTQITVKVIPKWDVRRLYSTLHFIWYFCNKLVSPRLAFRGSFAWVILVSDSIGSVYIKAPCSSLLLLSYITPTLLQQGA